MTEKCRHLEEYDNHGRYSKKCILTNNICTTAIFENGSGGIDLLGYRNRAAVYCPAYNLDGELARSLQKLHFDKQRKELSDKII